MTRDEALKDAWNEIFSLGGIGWLQEIEELQQFYSGGDFEMLNKAVWDILSHPTEYTSWIE